MATKKRSLVKVCPNLQFPASKRPKTDVIVSESSSEKSACVLSEHTKVIESVNGILNSKNMFHRDDILRFCRVVEDQVVKKIAEFEELEFRERKTRDALLQFLTALDEQQKNGNVFEFAKEMVLGFRNRRSEILKDNETLLFEIRSVEFALKCNSIPHQFFRDIKNMVGSYVKNIDGIEKLIAKYATNNCQWYALRYCAPDINGSWTNCTEGGFVRYLNYKTEDYLHDISFYTATRSGLANKVSFQSLRQDLKCHQMDQTADEEVAEFFYRIAAFLFQDIRYYEEEFEYWYFDQDWLMKDLNH